MCACFEKMEKSQVRAVMKYLVKKGLNATEIKDDMKQVLGESAPSYQIIRKQVTLFKRGRDSVEDDPRGGRLSTAITTETINKVHDMVPAYRRLKVREIAKDMDILLKEFSAS